MSSGGKRSAVHQTILNCNDELFSTTAKRVDLGDLMNRIQVIFKTPLFADAVKKVSESKTTTVDDLIEIIMDQNLAPRIKTNEFREKFLQFDTSKINELSPKRSCTVLWSACRSGQFEIVHLLLNVGGIKSWGFQQQSNGNMSTCLHGANWGGHHEVVAQLLNKECRPQKNFSNDEELFPYEEENPNVLEEKKKILRTIWDNYRNYYIAGITEFMPTISDELRGVYERKNKETINRLYGSPATTTSMTRTPQDSGKSSGYGGLRGLYTGLSNIMSGFQQTGDGTMITKVADTTVPKNCYSAMSLLQEKEEAVTEEAPASPEHTPVPAYFPPTDDASNLNHRFQEVAAKLFGT